MMGLNKSKNCKEGWGMGFLLVFFPEENNNNTNNNQSPTAIKVENTKLFSSSSSSSSFRRSNSSRILTKAQSTISICALLVFVTLLLFTLSTFEPNTRTTNSSRRLLTESRNRNRNPNPNPSRIWSSKNGGFVIKTERRALQGLGTLHRRGTKSMADLVVAHVTEETTKDELRLFLRAIHRSGLTAKSDLVLLFSSSFQQRNLSSLIQEENQSFLALIREYSIIESIKKVNKTGIPVKHSNPGLSFDPVQFRPGKKDSGEPIWGKKTGSSYNESVTESTRPSYGSVVGFDSGELDPESSLSGFVNPVPMGLRRWACYPMLLGRVRRNFKHVALIDARTAVVIGDQIGGGARSPPEAVHFYSSNNNGGRHGKRSSSDKAHHGGVNPAVISGGARGIRRLSDAMLAEIVRAATSTSQHNKKKSMPLTDSAILSQLVGNENLLKNVKIVKPGDSVPETSELGRLNGSNLVSFLKHSVVLRGNGNGNGNNGHEILKSVFMKHICSSEIDSSVYRDCPKKS